MNGSTPGFRLERRLLGANRVSGLVHDRFGRLRLTFSGLMEGAIESGALTMNAELHYSDGRIDRRSWRIAARGAHGYRGTTSDSIGDVTGTAQGDAVNLRYKLHLPIAGGMRRVSFDEWMYLQPDGLILDHAVMRIWGIRVGTVSAVIAAAHSPQDRLTALFGGWDAAERPDDIPRI
jgi:hypothetical protein